MAQEILRLETNNRVLREWQRELKQAERNVKKVGADALREALIAGKIHAEDIANNYWNGVETWVAKNTYTSKVNRNKLRGSVFQSGRKIELHRFMSREQMAAQWYAGENWQPVRPAGVRIKVYRNSGATIYPGTFIARMRSGFFSVFKRVKASRLPIKVQYAEQDMNYPLKQNLAQFEARASQVFARELNFALDDLLEDS